MTCVELMECTLPDVEWCLIKATAFALPYVALVPVPRGRKQKVTSGPSQRDLSSPPGLCLLSSPLLPLRFSSRKQRYFLLTCPPSAWNALFSPFACQMPSLSPGPRQAPPLAWSFSGAAKEGSRLHLSYPHSTVTRPSPEHIQCSALGYSADLCP